MVQSLRRKIAGLAGVAASGLALTACKLPSFGAFRGDTVQGRSTFHLFQGFVEKQKKKK
jgi:cytochrome c oxidase subunit 2